MLRLRATCAATIECALGRNDRDLNGYCFYPSWNLQSSTNLMIGLAAPAAASPWKPALNRPEQFHRWVR